MCIRLRDRFVNYRPLFGLTHVPRLLYWPEYLLIFFFYKNLHISW